MESHDGLSYTFLPASITRIEVDLTSKRPVGTDAQPDPIGAVLAV
jgi:hypothetical protein